MKPLRIFVPLAAIVLTLALGIPGYIAIMKSGAMPLALRDNPWPFELGCFAGVVVAVLGVMSAYRQARLRIVSTLALVLSVAFAAGFLAFVFGASAQLPPPPPDLKVGATLPDATLPDENGAPFSLSSLRGHTTLVVFYRGSWCPFCRSELLALSRERDAFASASVNVVAVSVDDPATSKQMKDELHLTMPLLSDPSASLITRLGLLHKGGHGSVDVARPADLVLDKDGVVRWAAFTDNFRIRTHPDAILEAAAAIPH
ncbi:MAG TPA: redoxin domain-containing protein [Myxococcota bacterium]|jgi:peroxiredoxin